MLTFYGHEQGGWWVGNKELLTDYPPTSCGLGVVGCHSISLPLPLASSSQSLLYRHLASSRKAHSSKSGWCTLQLAAFQFLLLFVVASYLRGWPPGLLSRHVLSVLIPPQGAPPQSPIVCGEVHSRMGSCVLDWPLRICLGSSPAGSSQLAG